jgi:hypothetical protein
LTVVNQTLHKEGVTALWKGVTPPLLAEGVLNHVWFGVYAMMASVFRPDPHMELPFSQAFIAGGVAGLVGSIIVTPTDLVKIQSQVNESTGTERRKPTQIIKEIYHREGFWGFTRGLSAVIIRDIPGLGMFFLDVTMGSVIFFVDQMVPYLDLDKFFLGELLELDLGWFHIPSMSLKQECKFRLPDYRLKIAC